MDYVFCTLLANLCHFMCYWYWLNEGCVNNLVVTKTFVMSTNIQQCFEWMKEN